MCVYLIHFTTPYKQASHYLGFAHEIDERLEAHRESRGARLLQVCNQNHIEYEVVRVWMGASRKVERRLKNNHNGRRLCPICNPNNHRGMI